MSRRVIRALQYGGLGLLALTFVLFLTRCLAPWLAVTLVAVSLVMQTAAFIGTVVNNRRGGK